MKIRFILTLLLITAGISMQAQNNGVGTKEPTHTLHVKPDVSNPNQDPLRLENLQSRRAAGDSTVLVVDPATGIVRYMPIDSLIRVIGGSDEISNLASRDMAQKAEERTYNVGGQKLTFENTGVNDNLLVIDGQNNRIGLGTNPQTGLDLSGVGQDGDGNMDSWDDYRIILDGAATPDKAYGLGTTASGLRLFSGGNQSFVNSGSEKMRIKGDGGILFNQYGQGDFDEANPEKILGLKPDGSVVEISPENLKASPQTLSLNGEKLSISDGNDVDLSDLKSESPWFNIATDKPAEANTDDLYLLGKVGIGTKDVDRDLIVNGSQKVTAQMAIGGDDQDGNYGMTARNSGAGAFFGYVGKNPNIPSEGAAIVAGNNKNIYMFTEKDGAAGSSQNPSLDVNIPRLTIEAESGQVGLGTTAPTKKLDVNGQARVRTLPNGATTDFIVTAAANGNLRKMTKDDLIGDIGGSIYSEDGTLTQNRAVTTGNFKLNIDANSLVVDGASNNVGIGTATPTQKLDVAGNIQTNGQLRINTADGDKIYLTNRMAQGSRISHSTGWVTDYKAGPGNGTSTTGGHRFFTTTGGKYESRLSIASNGFIGIGSTAPKSLLQIRNNVGNGASFDAFSDYQLLLYQANTAQNSYGLGIEGYTLAMNTNRDIDFKIKGTDKLTLTPTGLGIGTNAPKSLLQITNNVGNGASFDQFTDYQILLYQGNSSQNSYGLGIEGYTMALNSARDYDFKVQGVDKMTLTTAGLGIGTNAPSKLLDVNGEVRIRNLPAGAATDQIITTDANGNLRKIAAGDIGGSAGGSIYTENGALTQNRALTTGNFKLNIDANTLVVDGATNNVGIGTAAPKSLLQIRNNVGDATSFDKYTDYQLLLYQGNSPTNSYGLGIEGSTFAINSSAQYDFKIKGADKMTLTNAGLGIGLTNPRANLDVARGTGAWGSMVVRGTDRVTHFNYSTDEHTYIRGGKTSSHVFLNDNGGNVGVGTNKPTYKFQVGGGTNAFASLSTTRENGSATLYLGTPNGSVDKAQKTAIIAQGVRSWSRAKLHFALSSNGDDNTTAANAKVADSKMTIQYDGNVGIGITSPKSLLQIKNNVGDDPGGTASFNEWKDYQILLYQSGNAPQNSYGLGIEGSTFATNTGSTYDFNIKGTDKMTLNNTGLGVGINNPRANLDVARGTAGWGSMVVRGTDRVTHFHYSIDEHTYLRGGKRTSYVLLNDNGGNVGVGTNKPAYKFQVGGGTNASASISTIRENGDATLYLGTPNGAVDRAQKTAIIAEGVRSWSRAKLHFALSSNGNDNSTAANAKISDSKMTIQYNGNVGIGTTSPVTRLTLGNDILHDARFNYTDAQATFYESTNNGGNVPNGTRDIFHLVREGISGQAYGNKVSFSLGRYENVGTASRTQLDIKLTDGSFNQHNKVMSLRSNGNVGVGTEAPTQLLSVNGNAGKVGGGAWETFSDMRIKKNVAAYTDGLTQLMKIQPRTFQYNGKGGYKDDGKTYYGIIAQEIQKVAPYMVNEVKTEDFENQLSYDGTALTYMLVNAVKEQQKEIEDQQTQIQALQEENNILKAQAQKVDALSAKLMKIEAMLEKVNSPEK
ncbi:MAG: tail fiber domain-containing protein [Bacteroidota bacterium]